jgi:hypothetical protein
MNILDIAAKVTSLVMTYPFERHMRNNHEASAREIESMRSNLKQSLLEPAKTFPQRDAAMKALGACQVIHIHDDGDLTVECSGRLFVITTEGAVFQSVSGTEEQTAQSGTCPLEPDIVQDEAPKIQPKTLKDTIRMEQEGDYCLSCVPSKHLMRSHDAMKDAINIFNSKKTFTDVAEEKIQNAVYELNGAEKDLEMARVPTELEPVVAEFRNQVRKLRNFLRQDQSGLEIATAFPDKGTELKDALDKAYNVNGVLIKYGYDLSKAQMQLRAENKIANEALT